MKSCWHFFVLDLDLILLQKNCITATYLSVKNVRMDYFGVGETCGYSSFFSHVYAIQLYRRVVSYMSTSKIVVSSRSGTWRKMSANKKYDVPEFSNWQQECLIACSLFYWVLVVVHSQNVLNSITIHILRQSTYLYRYTVSSMTTEITSVMFRCCVLIVSLSPFKHRHMGPLAYNITVDKNTVVEYFYYCGFTLMVFSAHVRPYYI